MTRFTSNTFTEENYVKNSRGLFSRSKRSRVTGQRRRGGRILGQAGTTFVDVRDSGAIAQSGTVKGALRIPRGMIEFAADDTSKLHNENLNKEDRICLICAAVVRPPWRENHG